MTSNICCTTYLEPNEIFICMGTDMKTSLQFESQSLLPAERLAITAQMGGLLTAFGLLLQEHPDLRTALSPETGELLIKIGRKISKASNNPGAW